METVDEDLPQLREQQGEEEEGVMEEQEEEEEEPGVELHSDIISSLLGQELGEQVEAVTQLRLGLKQGGEHFRGLGQKMSPPEKLEKVEEMKSYIQQALACLACTATLATQKLDDSLRMQCEGLDRLEGALRQTALQVEMKNEMKARRVIGKLTTPKTKTLWSTIAVVDDPNSPWKAVPPKYRRTVVDLTALDGVGVTGLGDMVTTTSTNKTLRTQSIGNRSTMSMGQTMGRTMSRQGRENMRTLKKVSMPSLKQMPVLSGSPEFQEEPSPPHEDSAPPTAPPPAPAPAPAPASPQEVKRKNSCENPFPTEEDEICANPFNEEDTTTDVSFDDEADEDTEEEGLGDLPIIQRRGGGTNKGHRLSSLLPPAPDDDFSGIFSSLRPPGTATLQEEPEFPEDDLRLPTPPPDPSYAQLPPPPP